MGAHLRARDPPLHRRLGERLQVEDHVLGDLERGGRPAGRPQSDVARHVAAVLRAVRRHVEAPQGEVPPPEDRRLRQMLRAQRHVRDEGEARTGGRGLPPPLLRGVLRLHQGTEVSARLLLLPWLHHAESREASHGLPPRAPAQGRLRGRGAALERVALRRPQGVLLEAGVARERDRGVHRGLPNRGRPLDGQHLRRAVRHRQVRPALRPHREQAGQGVLRAQVLQHALSHGHGGEVRGGRRPGQRRPVGRGGEGQEGGCRVRRERFGQRALHFIRSWRAQAGVLSRRGRRPYRRGA